MQGGQEEKISRQSHGAGTTQREREGQKLSLSVSPDLGNMHVVRNLGVSCWTPTKLASNSFLPFRHGQRATSIGAVLVHLAL